MPKFNIKNVRISNQLEHKQPYENLTLEHWCQNGDHEIFKKSLMIVWIL